MADEQQVMYEKAARWRLNIAQPVTSATPATYPNILKKKRIGGRRQSNRRKDQTGASTTQKKENWPRPRLKSRLMHLLHPCDFTT